MPLTRSLDPHESAFVDFYQKLLATGALGFGSPALSPGAAGEANSDSLTALLQGGGRVVITTPGTYLIESWPTGIPVSTELYLGPDVILSDGSATVSGPITLEGGLWPNGRTGTAATVTSGQNTVTCANIGFTSADVGKYIVVRSALAITLAEAYRSTIVSVTNGVATCVAPFTFSNAGAAMVACGSDNFAALTALLAARDHLTLPDGLIFCAGPLVVRNGCSLTSNSPPQNAELDKYPTIGTWLHFVGATDEPIFVKVGTSGVFGINPGKATFTHVGVDGNFRTTIAVSAAGWNSRVEHCAVLGGFANQISLGGSSVAVMHNYSVGRGSSGDNILCQTADNEIIGNIVRGCGPTNCAMIRILNGGTTRISNNHTWDSDSQLCWQIRIVATTSTEIIGIQITDNELEVGNGHTISIACSGTGTNRVSATLIANNQAYHTGTTFTDDTFDFVNTVAPAGQVINGLIIRDNIGIQRAARNWRSVWSDEGAVPATGVNLSGNMFEGCDDLIFAGTPFYSAGNGVSDKAARTTWTAT